MQPKIEPGAYNSLRYDLHDALLIARDRGLTVEDIARALMEECSLLRSKRDAFVRAIEEYEC